MAKHRLMEISTVSGAGDEMMAVDLMKQELSEETSPQSSLVHGNVGESPADELP